MEDQVPAPRGSVEWLSVQHAQFHDADATDPLGKDLCGEQGCQFWSLACFVLSRYERAAGSATDLSSLEVDGRRLTWREAHEQQGDVIRHLRQWERMVGDLDRNEHGRHQGDADSTDPSGVSQGNPQLKTGDLLAYSMAGVPYVVPKQADRHRPEAWVGSSA